MEIRRIQSFEFEDLTWFPHILRTNLTDFLKFQSEFFGYKKVFAELAIETALKLKLNSLVELCAGSGGMAHEVLKLIEEKNLPLNYFATDKYPNVEAFSELKRLFPTKFNFSNDQLDAAEIPSSLSGLRIFCTSFHHFPENTALKILEESVAQSEPISIFEVTERSLIKMVQIILASTLWLWIITPLLKPFSLKRIFLTYVFPLMPLIIAWDGLVSCLRSYNKKDFQKLISQSEKLKLYNWQIATQYSFPGNASWFYRLRRIPLYTLIGYPSDITMIAK